MLARTLVTWLGLLVLAIVNGAFREGWLVPRSGHGTAHAVSTAMLCVLIVVGGWMAVPWIGPRSTHDAWIIGGTWVVLTLAFEFLAGHFLFGKPWQELFADYNIAAGRIWVLVLIVTLVAPVLAYRGHSG